jgi:hypothetical protein
MVRVPKPQELPPDRFRVLLWCDPMNPELRRPEWAWRVAWREGGEWQTTDEQCGGPCVPQVLGAGDWSLLPPPPRSIYE